MTRKVRADGEGSIFPRGSGYAAYVWVTTPTGTRRRKYVYGKDRATVHDKWIRLQEQARRGPVVTKQPNLSQYLNYWLDEVVKPGLKPKTASTYKLHARLYLIPLLGDKRLDKLDVQSVRGFFNKLATMCQCCTQGKDAARPEKLRRCCARGECCHQALSKRTIHDVRAVLRSALSNAVIEERISRNPAALVKLPAVKRRKVKPWSVEEARTFLVSAREAGDPFYAAYVLILVLGLRRGEALGLSWKDVDLDAGELTPVHGLQRINGVLLLGEVKTEDSESLLPLPDICLTALELRKAAQHEDRLALDARWPDDERLVFTTRTGSPIDPRNFARSFDRRCRHAGVRRIRVHDTRHTCASLLAALDVHPRVAMQILRHSKIDTTMEIYTHVPSKVTRQALKQLGASLDGLDGLSA